MRSGFPASPAGAWPVGADAYTLKLAVGRFLALCKAEHLPPAEILVRFDTFLAEYNAQQKRWLVSSSRAVRVE